MCQDCCGQRSIRPIPHPARGKLAIFFGMAPGVGKTYAMLQAAGRKKLPAGTW